MPASRSSSTSRGNGRAQWHISALPGRRPRQPKDSEAAVLGALRATATPLTAYQIRDEIIDRDQRIAPMQVYRVLQRLIESRQVVRIESLSAYVLAEAGTDGIAVCDRCGRYIALKLAVAANIAEEVARTGFVAAKQVIEVAGTCLACRQAQSGVHTLA